AVAAMAEYRAVRERRRQAVEGARSSPAAIDLVGPILCEYEAAPLLAQSGIGMPAAHLAKSAEAAVEAAKRLGGRVALKVQSPDIPHKNHAGAVALHVESGEAAARAYDWVLANA